MPMMVPVFAVQYIPSLDIIQTGKTLNGTPAGILAGVYRLTGGLIAFGSCERTAFEREKQYEVEARRKAPNVSDFAQRFLLALHSTST